MGYNINKDGSVSRNGTSSILEKYPEFNFKLSSTNDKRGVSQKLVLFFACLVLIWGEMLCGVGFAGVFLSNQPVGYLLCVIPCIVIPILLVFLIKWYLNSPTKSQVSDYIQSTTGKTICVKEGKFGVLNNFNNKLIIPTMYDKLTWAKKDQLLRAELKGKSFLIDIHNNRLK